LQHPHGDGDVNQSLRDSVEGGHGVSHIGRVYHSRSRILEWCGRAQLSILLS
jgi:hypothetical protein